MGSIPPYNRFFIKRPQSFSLSKIYTCFYIPSGLAHYIFVLNSGFQSKIRLLRNRKRRAPLCKLLVYSPRKESRTLHCVLKHRSSHFCVRNKRCFAGENLLFLFVDKSKDAHNVFCTQLRFRTSLGLYSPKSLHGCSSRQVLVLHL